MTRNARRFVGEVTFEAITRRRVITGQWTPGANADIEHIAIASDIALLLVVPATANTIGKFAHGIADDFLSSLYLATTAPVLLAPAMNTNMLAHPAVQQNLRGARRRGACSLSTPATGYLACGWIGKGRLAEADAIVAAAEAVLARRQHAAGQARRGDGRSDLRGSRPGALHRQPVERPDGLRDCRRAGPPRREVTLITGPDGDRTSGRGVGDSRPVGRRDASRRAGRGAGRPMRWSWPRRWPTTRPISVAAQKIAHDDEDARPLTLAATPDILADVAAWRAREGRAAPLLVGFAAETEDVVERARAKRLRKGIDVIVANDVSGQDIGFDVDANAVTIIGAERRRARAPGVEGRHRRGACRPSRAVARPPVRRSPGMSTARDLAAHLRYLQDLGVDGVSRGSRPGAFVRRRTRERRSRHRAGPS